MKIRFFQYIPNLVGDTMLDIRDIPIPEVYKESSDFRFFIEWIADCLEENKTDIENLVDNYDPLRIKTDLIWMLGESMGFKYDNRLPPAFNRLVLMYFMSMIRNKGSKDGVTLAALVNLAEFNVLDRGKEKEILYDRLEDTSIPVNMVYVTPHTPEGYIDITYFSTDVPIDSCIEYVRPLGMYCFQRAGVRVDGRTKISVDAKLTDSTNVGMSIGPTHVGHYRREDYSRLQKMYNEKNHEINPRHSRRMVYGRNSDVEKTPKYNAGYRALYSMQLCNNENIVKSALRDPIFSLGYGPKDVVTYQSESYLKRNDENMWNLRLDRTTEQSITEDVFTSEKYKADDVRPVVNPIMGRIGEAISLNPTNTKYTKWNDDLKEIKAVDQESKK